MPPVGRRVTICPVDATNISRELTRFEVDAAATSLWSVVERIIADAALLNRKTAQGPILVTRLLTFEGCTAGDQPRHCDGAPRVDRAAFIADGGIEWPHRVRRGPRAVARRGRLRYGY